jgi:hypothetical protein
MNQDLKNRGLNPVVIAISVVIALVLLISPFVKGNAIYEAPLLNKILGYGLMIFGGVFAWKSEKWLDFIESDRILLWGQILGTLALIAAGMITLVSYGY